MQTPRTTLIENHMCVMRVVPESFCRPRVLLPQHSFGYNLIDSLMHGKHLQCVQSLFNEL